MALSMSARLEDASTIFRFTFLGEGPIGWPTGTLRDALEIAADYLIVVEVAGLDDDQIVCRATPRGMSVRT